MIGGTVVEVCEVPGHVDRLYVNCMDRPYNKSEYCAIYVVKNDISSQIEIGDSIWWQGRFAMWTPQRNRQNCGGKGGSDYDIRIPRIGYSGVAHPSCEVSE